MEKFQPESDNESIRENQWGLGRVDVSSRGQDVVDANEETASYLEDLHDAMKSAGADEAAKEALELFIHLSSESSAGDVTAAVDDLLSRRQSALASMMNEDPTASVEANYLNGLRKRRAREKIEAGKSLDDRTNFVG